MSARPPENPALSDMQGEHDEPSTQTIQECLAWMGRYTQPDRVANLVERNRYLSIDGNLLLHLIQWMPSLFPKAQWIEGPAVTTEPSQNTLATAMLITAFKRVQIPVISYFCCNDQRNHAPVSYGTELLNMVFALIYQISTIIPEDLSSWLDSEDIPDLSASRLNSLQPDLQSLPAAIELLGDMLAIVPSSVFACCIDGLQFLDKEDEGEGYKACFQQFVKVLGYAQTGYPRVLKIWLSTDGHSGSLQDAVEERWMQTRKTVCENQDESLRIDMIQSLEQLDMMYMIDGLVFGDH